MPFGLKCAPETFCRLMSKVLAGLNYVDCLVYLDDIIVFSSSLEEHLERIERVFGRLRQHNLMINPKKTFILKKNVTYLGHCVSADGFRPDNRLLESVLQDPVPTSKKLLKTFLGLAGYYREFIPDLAVLAAPLIE
jgi:hypothetical protein